MALTDGAAESYGFSIQFEKALAVLCCSRPKFWGRIGTTLDPDALKDEASKLAITAVKAIAVDLGRGPSSSLIVVQRLRRWMDDGKVTLEQIRLVGELLEDMEDNLPPEDEVISEVTPVLKRRAQQQAVRMAIKESARGDDLSEVAAAIERADRIGVVDTSQGIRIGSGSFEEIRKLRRMQRLPTGIDDLDVQLAGGLARRSLGVVVGGGGEGKSMFLSHIAAQCMYDGLAVVYATLEIPEGEVLARVKANLTELSINSITSGDDEAECITRLTKLAARKFDFRPGLGLGIVKEFSPGSTTYTDIREWITMVEQAENRPIDVFIVDYADRMGVPKEQGDYSAGKIIYEGLRSIADEKGIFGWTACQATRGAKDRKRKDLSDMADSMHKGRIADLVITINRKGDDEDELEYFVAKHRTGLSRIAVGPLPHDWAHGQMVPVVRGF